MEEGEQYFGGQWPFQNSWESPLTRPIQVQVQQSLENRSGGLDLLWLRRERSVASLHYRQLLPAPHMERQVCDMYQLTSICSDVVCSAQLHEKDTCYCYGGLESLWREYSEWYHCGRNYYILNSPECFCCNGCCHDSKLILAEFWSGNDYGLLGQWNLEKGEPELSAQRYNPPPRNVLHEIHEVLLQTARFT